MTGPAGGLIFFVDYHDQYAGFNYLEAVFVDYHDQYAGFNYLEAAPQGWGDGIAVNSGLGEITGSATEDPNMRWCSVTTTLLSVDEWSNSGVGKGATNTSTADTTCEEGAIQAAANYAGGSQTDWFLPSIGELMLMYNNLRQAGVGGFQDNRYWSSSEVYGNHAWINFFDSDGQWANSKSYPSIRVRPVRAF